MLTILLMYKHCLKPICYSALYKLLEAALFCSSSLLCISNSNWTTENEPGRSVSVNGNEEPRWRDLSPIQFSSNSSYSLITHNKAPVHSTWGLLRVCAACPTPLLNLSFELRPSWKQHPRYVPHRVRAGYNSNSQFPPPPNTFWHWHQTFHTSAINDQALLLERFLEDGLTGMFSSGARIWNLSIYSFTTL